ncbi:MAG: hypothetical protein JW860_01695 [Sedimentisphaerales bacterium]|nr:hypothetical protein [Sedimentisphaerales bacterium]
MDWFDGSVEIDAQADVGQVTLELPTCGGVCLFTAADNQPVQLLVGGNLRTLARRRLAEDAEDEKTRRTRIRSVVEKVWYRRCYSPFETHLVYFHIACAVYPDTYQELFPKLDAWLVQVDRDAAYPFFARTRQMQAGSHLYWGPFADGKSAGRCVELLQDIFDLCRCPEVLAFAPQGRPCSYAQMNRCVAVCNGTMSCETYREVIERAIDFLNHPQRTIEKWENQMQDCSAALEFEKAQRLKALIDEAKKLLTPAFRWVAPLEEFLVLAFQPGPKIKIEGSKGRHPTVSPFLIGPGRIHQIASFPLAQAAEGCKQLLDHIHLALFQESNQSLTPARHQLFAWSSHLLYRKIPRDKGVYVKYALDLTAGDLAQTVTGHFSRPDRSVKDSGKLHLDTLSLSTQNDGEDEDS